MDNKIILRIDSLLENIDKILDDTKDCTIDDFYKSDILLRATCFFTCSNRGTNVEN